MQLTTFQISAPGGRPMQISVYRSQNGVRYGRKEGHTDRFRSKEKSNQTHATGRHLCGQVIKRHISKNQEKLFLILNWSYYVTSWQELRKHMFSKYFSFASIID